MAWKCSGCGEIFLDPILAYWPFIRIAPLTGVAQGTAKCLRALTCSKKPLWLCRANGIQMASFGGRLWKQHRGRGDTVSREKDLKDSKCCCCERSGEGQSERARYDSEQ